MSCGIRSPCSPTPGVWAPGWNIGPLPPPMRCFWQNGTRVATGVVFDGQVEILEGLTAGAQVVVQGNEALQNGQRVTLLPARSS